MGVHHDNPAPVMAGLLCSSQSLSEPGAGPRDWASGVGISQSEAPGVSLCHCVIVFCINPQLRNVMTGCH